MNEEKEKKEEEGTKGGGIQNEAEEFKKCLAEREEYLNGWRRAKADLENYKKDEAVRAEMIVKFSNELLVRELIAILDSFDVAIKTEPENEGLCLIREQLEKTLAKYGLTEIKAETGQKFDPKEQEAVETAVAEEKEADIIIEVIERGWKLYEKVIKPVRVRVSK